MGSCLRPQLQKQGDVQDLKFKWLLILSSKSSIAQGTMSAFMAGVMVGAFLLGKLADRLYFLLRNPSPECPSLLRIGRKHTITLTVVGITIFNTLSGLTGSFHVYVGAKFMTGFFCAGNILSMFVLSNELVGGSMRAVVGTTMQVLSANILEVSVNLLHPGLLCPGNYSVCACRLPHTRLAISHPHGLLPRPSFHLPPLASS